MSSAVDANEAEAPRAAIDKYRGAVAITVAVAALGYLAYAVWSGFSETASELVAFAWPLYVPILGLTLVNYGLRYAKWAWLLRRLGVQMPWRANVAGFIAGLAMVISPGKAGELVKPWLVREVTGTPMARTIPALVAERLTDGIAVVVLAGFGVATYRPESVPLIVGTLAALALGLLVFSIDPLAEAVFRGMERPAPLRGLVAKLRESHGAMRTCLGPFPLVVTLVLSMLAWYAECVGYWLVFRGLDVPADLGVSTFLYAFATVFGAPSPGGMGMADIALVEGAERLIPAITEPQALAAALLVRVATLWFGVLLGAFTLLGLDPIVRRARAELT